MKARETSSNITLGDDSRVRISTKLDSGRWRKEEHELFLKGLEMFGRDWKKIESLVGTRTGPQIRSHAQKYFNKMGKDAGSGSETKSTIKIARGSMSNASSQSGRGAFKDPDTTNLRKRKEEEKFKNSKSPNMDYSSILTPLNTQESFSKLKIPSACLDDLNLNPLVSEEKGATKVANKLECEDSNLNRKDSSRSYTESEVLTLIRHLVKEFVNIMGRYSAVQQPLLTSSAPQMNLNSILLLSLMCGEQQKTSVTSSISNLFNMGSNLDKQVFTNNYQASDLASLIKDHLPCESSPRVSSENLSKIPKANNRINLNFPNLNNIQSMVNFSQSQNSYSQFVKISGRDSDKSETEEPLKRYDSTSGEGRYESDTNPTIEARADQN